MKTGVLRKLHKDSKGFTLIELMIVVAIIGILAAIAIPQFAAYRIRGFNTSALSDVRNTNTGETAYFADWQVYGGTAAVAVANGATAAVAGTVLTGPIAVGAGFITSNDSSSIARSQAVQAGNGVSILADTDAACDSVNIMSKHLQGDTWYAVDSDSDAIYFTQDKTNGVGSVLAAGNMIAPVVTTLQFTAAAAVPGAAGTAWAAK